MIPIQVSEGVGRMMSSDPIGSVAQRMRRAIGRWRRHRIEPALGVMPPMPGALALGVEEARAVRDVVRSQRLGRYISPWNSPSHADELERRLAEFLEVDGCLAVSSGTAALHCALVGLGIGPGDEVIVPGYTWRATAAAVCLAGAVPIMADIDETLTLDPNSVERAITNFTRAIIVVHMRGAPGHMDRLQGIAAHHGLFLIEDAAQAMGARHRGRRLGTIGDVGCYSMQTCKILCVGEGGAVVARDPEVFQRMRAFHGETSAASTMLSANYSMNELAAAIGCVQLGRIDGLLARMRDIRGRLHSLVETLAPQRGLALREELDVAGEAATGLIWFEAHPGAAEQTTMALRAMNVCCSRPYRPGVPDAHVYAHWGAIMSQRSLSARGGPWRDARRAIEYRLDMCPRTLDLLGRAVEVTILPQFTDPHVTRIECALANALSRPALVVAHSSLPARPAIHGARLARLTSASTGLPREADLP